MPRKPGRSIALQEALGYGQVREAAAVVWKQPSPGRWVSQDGRFQVVDYVAGWVRRPGRPSTHKVLWKYVDVTAGVEVKEFKTATAARAAAEQAAST